jgi:hypothetical protein
MNSWRISAHKGLPLELVSLVSGLQGSGSRPLEIH